jgi:hypothetical protein
MTRIESNAPGNIQPRSFSGTGKVEEFSLDRLPEELPSPSHTKVSSLDIARLIMPDGVDLSRVPKEHPLCESLNALWLEVTLKAIVAGGEHSKSSLPSLTPPMEPLG